MIIYILMSQIKKSTAHVIMASKTQHRVVNHLNISSSTSSGTITTTTYQQFQRNDAIPIRYLPTPYKTSA